MKEELLILDSKSFFRTIVIYAMKECRIEITPLILDYLVDLLQFYIVTDNLYEENLADGKKTQKTLAERLLVASSADLNIKKDLLKRLGDSSLYVSGFFGDSLKRKIVDIDYYADIGGMAYGSLAACTQEKMMATVYDEFSCRFLEYVDVLTVISQGALIQSKEDVLRLYDKYMATGSDLAKKQLIKMGVLNLSDLKDQPS